jgi:hypothetical protein
MLSSTDSGMLMKRRAIRVWYPPPMLCQLLVWLPHIDHPLPRIGPSLDRRSFGKRGYWRLLVSCLTTVELPPCNPSCGVSVFAPPDGALFLTLGVGVPLPTATGVYTLSGSGLFNFAGGQGTLDTSPVGTLDVTGASVPEPRTSIGLFSIALATLAWKLRKQLA